MYVFEQGKEAFKTGIIDRRMCADIEGDFVLFLIGMRVNRPLRFRK